MTAPPERRISTSLAATYLGVDRRHVVRLVAAGALDGVDVRLPGARRPTWAVTLASVRAFLAARASANNGLDGLSASEGPESRRAGATGGRQ